MHVTVRLRDGLPSLRQIAADAVIRECFVKAQGRFGVRVVDYSIQHNHLHLIVEADSKPSLARGMQALLVRIARALNKLWGRRGSIFADRYHAHVLQKPREVRNAIAYVINNARKHGHRPRSLDRFSSGPWFDGWKEDVVVRGLEGVRTPVAEPRTWLRGKGWRRHGLIRVAERPGERPERRPRSARAKRAEGERARTLREQRP